MSVAEFIIYLNNNPATQEQLELFNEIKVDQAIGMATEAELQMDIGMDERGNWSGMAEDFVQPFHRVRVEVRIREGDFVPLIDGPIVAQKFELSASPNNSRIVLVVQDDSVLMNQEEEVTVFEERSPDDIAQTLFQQYGLNAETDAVAVPAGGLSYYTVQRGTAMQLLRRLAQRHGMFVYVKPDETPGSSTGVFKHPDFQASELPDLLLVGADHNINSFSVQFDGLRPLKARADNVDITNQDLLSSETDTSDLEPQGDTAVHDMIEAGRTLLTRVGAEGTELDAITAAAVNHSSWAYEANAEVIADNYSGVLSPYKMIRVTGAGSYLSGDWLISHVTHTINNASYQQQFTLRRNARSNGAGGVSGSLGGGIF
jgi:phage protein D